MTTVGRWSPNKVRERVLNGTWVSAEELGGMVLVTPSSVTVTGGGSQSATILANGSVEFSSCASILLNGVFNSLYNNYMISMRVSEASNADATIAFLLSANGTPNETANSYVCQRITASSTTVSAQRDTIPYGWAFGVSSAQRSGATGYIYGPYLTQPTALRFVDVSGQSDATIVEYASTHNQSTAYDGIMFSRTSFSYTGLVSVYGLVGA